MVRDVPAWALQQQSDPEHRDEIASSLVGQSQTGYAPFLPLMTISETAAILRLAPRTIRRMIKRGELNSVKIGRSIRIRLQDVRQIISESAHG